MLGGGGGGVAGDGDRSAALPAGATEARPAPAAAHGAAAAGRGGGWTPLDEGMSVGGLGGAALPWLHGVEFRVNAAAGAAQDTAGPISQTVTYTASCAGPGP